MFCDPFIKFKFSEKATKICTYLPFIFDVTSKGSSQTTLTRLWLFFEPHFVYTF
jgi:hypothetical protein